MRLHYRARAFRRIMVPIVPGGDNASSLAAARLIAGPGGKIILVGVVGIPAGVSLSVATSQARQVRETLLAHAADERVHVRERVRVSYAPWEELQVVIHEELPDLLILAWPHAFETLRITPTELFEELPCDLAIVRGPIEEHLKRILVPLRGSVYAEQALRLSLLIAQTADAEVASLRVVPPDESAQSEASFRGLERVLQNLPEVAQDTVASDDVAATILERSAAYDLVVVGTSARLDEVERRPLLGEVTERILEHSEAGVIAVRTTHALPEDLEGEEAGRAAISILVDKWFAENTYYADEFADLNYLLSLKERQGVTISLALPALNEEETVGNVIRTVKKALMDEVPLLDEIVLMDSNSTDRTREIAEDLGIPVYIHQKVLPQYGARAGKGEALWKSLYVTRGDIILWIDTDIVNIHPRFVYGLMGPLLLRDRTKFVKGFYRRPLKVGDKIQAGGGGRVTELTARPLLNLFYPELSGIIQPLSGEYGGRREVLERLPFSSGYGVEIAMLIDVFERYGLSAIAQVDLQKRIHHNQPLEALSKMSFAIIQAVARKLERRYGWQILEEVNRSMKLIRYEKGRFFLEVEEIAERERPPMIELPEYRERHGL